MSNKGLEGWLKKHESGEIPTGLNASEQEELARYDRLWEAAAPPTSKLEVDTNAAWAKLDDRLFGDEKIVALDAKKSRQKGVNSNWVLRIAAAITVLAVAAFSVMSYLNQPQTNVLAFSTLDGIEEIALPDGSHISLNTNSELTYVADGATRQIELTGEAFFDVARDEERPFTITTGDLTTTVLGTSFNIRAYADESVEVSVKSGKVAVAAEKEEVVLTKAEQVIYQPEAKKLSRKTEAVVEADAWKTGQLEFAGDRLRVALPILERFYNQKFEFTNQSLLDCGINLEFKGVPLDQAISDLSFAYSTQVVRRGEVIVFEGGECP